MYMKKLFVKTVAFVSAVVLSMTLFAGCGSKDTATNEQGQTVIRVGGWPDKEGTELTNIEKRKADFEAANTDVVIEPDLWKFDRKTFYAKAAGGQLPDVYQAGFTEIAEIINSEYAADLTDVLKERGTLDMLNDLPCIMTTKDVMKYLQIGKNTMLNLIHSKQLTAHRISGGHWRILREDLLEYILNS